MELRIVMELKLFPSPHATCMIGTYADDLSGLLFI